MKYSSQFEQQFVTLREEVIEAIEANLKRIGKIHTDEDETPLEFFSFASNNINGISEIHPDGTLKFKLNYKSTLRYYIDTEYITLGDAISLLKGLEEI